MLNSCKLINLTSGRFEPFEKKKKKNSVNILFIFFSYHHTNLINQHYIIEIFQNNKLYILYIGNVLNGSF
jgi:hypothetical protein